MRIFPVLIAMAVTGSLAAAAAAAPGLRGRPGVTIASASDASPGRLASHERERHAEIVRQALRDVLHRSGADVRRGGMPMRQIDVSVVGWNVATLAGRIDVSAVLRLVICDDHGRMLSIVTGRASVSGRSTQLAALREQVLAEAIGGMTRQLASQLARATS
jgi:hypothetical protein